MFMNEKTIDARTIDVDCEGWNNWATGRLVLYSTVTYGGMRTVTWRTTAVNHWLGTIQAQPYTTLTIIRPPDKIRFFPKRRAQIQVVCP